MSGSRGLRLSQRTKSRPECKPVLWRKALIVDRKISACSKYLRASPSLSSLAVLTYNRKTCTLYLNYQHLLQITKKSNTPRVNRCCIKLKYRIKKNWWTPAGICRSSIISVPTICLNVFQYGLCSVHSAQYSFNSGGLLVCWKTGSWQSFYIHWFLKPSYQNSPKGGCINTIIYKSVKVWDKFIWMQWVTAFTNGSREIMTQIKYKKQKNIDINVKDSSYKHELQSCLHTMPTASAFISRKWLIWSAK